MTMIPGMEVVWGDIYKAVAAAVECGELAITGQNGDFYIVENMNPDRRDFRCEVPLSYFSTAVLDAHSPFDRDDWEES